MSRKNFSATGKAVHFFNNIGVFLITLFIVYPLLLVISASLCDPGSVSAASGWLWPVDITWGGFQRVFQDGSIWRGYGNTIYYTLLGTAIHLIVLLPCSYALSRKEILGKKIILWFILFTMLFNGGLIPTYLLIKSLGMVDTVWAIVIPGVVGAWSILVGRAFFEQNIPDELVDASRIDGASEFYIFRKIVLPLSLPIIAVMALFHGVSLWNQYFGALIYLSERKMYPLQLILSENLLINERSAEHTSELQ